MKMQTVQTTSDLKIGLAAEFIVCADLILKGYNAFLTLQSCSYDVCVEVNNKIFRIQVKATRKPHLQYQRKTPYKVYMWHIKRRGRGNKRKFKFEDYDILALVALDVKKIAYVLFENKLTVIHLRAPDSIISTNYNSKRTKSMDAPEFLFENLIKAI